MTDRNEYQRAYYYAHREERKAAQRAYRATHLELVMAQEAARRADPEYKAEARMRTAEWRRQNRGRARAYSREWFAAHRADANAKRKSRYEESRTESLAKAAKYRAEHRDEINRKQRGKHKHSSEYDRRYYESNAVKRREQVRAWNKDHPELRSHYVSAYRARRAGNGGSHTLAEWQEKVSLFTGCCAYCGEEKPLTRDHKIPLSRGGTDDIFNVIPACHSCNSKKQRMTATEYLALRKVA